MQFENEIIASFWNSKTMQHSRFKIARFSNCINRFAQNETEKHGNGAVLINNGLNKIKSKIIN
jgi:hypothetical protein